ncbi:MAG: DUF1598 domain-containing protein [Pirellulales bacterium]|nr:DUF1598 domain-containing protein [Pirellulales bacterium]
MRQFRSKLSVAILAALGVALAFPAVSLGMDEDAFQAHLRAGEFAPAMAMANAAEPAFRDAMLSKIAEAQAAAGMRKQSLTTLAEVSNDLSRAHSFAEILAQPLGTQPADRSTRGSRSGGAAGGNQANFGDLINLITSTTGASDGNGWLDDGTGNGQVEQFQGGGGVRVDAEGLVESLINKDQDNSLSLLRDAAARSQRIGSVHDESLLRKVSLTRLERAIQLKLALGEPIDEEMQFLAGLQKIEYVFTYPETGDIVIAGSASDWHSDAEGRVIGTATGRPVLRLDDLLVVLREMADGDKNFGCSITPIQEHLARTKAYIAESSRRPLRPGQTNRWLKGIRDQLAEQEIEFYGVDPRTHVARVLFEADYRMKLTGIGVEAGAAGVPSYLSMVKVKPGEAAPPMGVLRWWFTTNYDSIRSSKAGNAYELRGQGVMVKSENEMIADDGRRVHTGQSDRETAAFAENFTKHFEAMAQKYPVYAELQNIFDLAIVAALINTQDLPGQVGWHMTTFADDAKFPVSLGYEPKMVQTVMNHKIVNRTQVLAVASGGVTFRPGEVVKASAIEQDSSGRLSSIQDRTEPNNLDRGQWWWD